MPQRLSSETLTVPASGSTLPRLSGAAKPPACKAAPSTTETILTTPPSDCQVRTMNVLVESQTAGDKCNFGIGSPVSLRQIEEAHIRRVVATAPSLKKAAEILGIDQATLWRRRKEYNL
jgi:transcriptional regulator of acetoin/glycerol metabolism